MDVSQQDVCRRLKATLRYVIGYDDFNVPGKRKLPLLCYVIEGSNMRTSGGSHCGNYVLPTLLLAG